MLRKSIRIFLLFALLLAGALLAVITWLGLPSAVAGFAARTVCSGVFMAGRSGEDVLARDVLPASALLRLASVTIDTSRREVRGWMPAGRERVAVHVAPLGCVLDPAAEVLAQTGVQAGPRTGAGTAAPAAPAGTAAPTQWPRGAAPARLAAVLDEAFRNDGEAAGRNARAVVILQDGRLLAERYAPGFDERTRQIGWSMTKTVLGLLVHARLAEQRQTSDVRALDWVAPQRRPPWLRRWQDDGRAGITVGDLLYMRDGLDHEEGYAPWDAVPRMLWGVSDVAAYAGSAAAEAEPGTRFRYLSATSNLLSGLLRLQFADDRDYWRYPRQVLFDPIGAASAVIETDATGTFIGSSYLWATPRDWARIGQALMSDGRLEDRQVFPAGWLARALDPPSLESASSASPAMGYGAQVWLAGRPQSTACPADSGLPADTLMMTGHFGQVVAMVPSRQAVIVRLGMTTERGRFDRCVFARAVLDALERPAGATE